MATVVVFKVQGLLSSPWVVKALEGSGVSSLAAKVLTQNVRHGFEFHLEPFFPAKWMFQEKFIFLYGHLDIKGQISSSSSYINYLMCIYDTTMSVYMPHMNSLLSTLWPEALVYINYISLAYAQNRYVHMFVPFHYYFSIHKDPTVLQISIKHNKMQL